MFNVVLVEPRIPQNVGNIARTCAATGCGLHIVFPIPFEITDKKLKRAGLDYWQYLNVNYYEDLADFFKKTNSPDARYHYATTKAPHIYTEAEFKDNDYLLFGREDAGLPEELLYEHEERCLRIPMIPEARSLNLSNAVAVVVYEAMRQMGFDNLKSMGQLTKFHW